MNENEMLLEMLKEVFPDEFDFLGESMVRRIIEDRYLWTEPQAQLKGGEGADYAQIVDLVIAALNFGAAVIRLAAETKRISSDESKAQREREIEQSKIIIPKQDEIERFMKRRL